MRTIKMLILISLILSIANCGESPEKARKKLIEFGIKYSPNDFINKAVEGDLYATKLFLSAGMDVNTKDEKGMTALMWAAFMGKKDVLNLLLKKGADKNIIDKEGNSIMHFAVISDDTSILKIFIDSKINMELKNNQGTPPLINAIASNKKNAVKFLIKNGENVNTTANENISALMILLI
ncbi:MAG TPA: ankyrin repeat domain-containing protein [Candidatus Lokiarchaeia archaeon]